MSSTLTQLAFSGILLSLCASHAHSQASWAWAGLGMATCAEAVSDQSNPLLKAAYGQWTWGFWTGLNSEKVLNGQPYRSLSVFRDELQVADAVISECGVNPPEQKIAVVAMIIYERFGLGSLK